MSDPESRTIDAWGLRNQAARGREIGVPHPGAFLISRDLRVVERAFEQAYQERATAAGLIARIGGAVGAAAPAVVEGGQLRATTAVSDSVAAPGQRVTLIVDLAPKPGMHVYAPGQTGYIPVAVVLDASAEFRSHAMQFPPPGTYFYAPLKETVKVYSATARLTQDITLALTPELRKRAAAGDKLVITGSLNYQACDDKVCYRPETIAVSWSIALTPFVRTPE